MTATFAASASVAILALASSAFLSAVGPADTQPGGQASAQGQDAGQSDDSDARRIESAGATVSGFRIAVEAIEDVRGHAMTSEYDLSRMEVQGSTIEESDSNESRFGDPSGGGFGRGSARGFGGGAAGGFGTSFAKPTFGVAMSITPTSAKNAEVVELGSRAAAYDAHGELIDEYDLGPAINHFQAFEQRHPGDHFLYFASKKRGVPDVRRITGELRVTPGEIWEAQFDGDKPQSKPTPGGEIKLTGVSTTDEGVTLTVEFPVPSNERNSKSPIDRFHSRLTNRGATQIWIVDDAGDRHQPKFSSVGAKGGDGRQSFSRRSTFSQGGRSGKRSVRSSVSTTANAPHQVSFAPLPEGRKIQSIHAAMVNRTGEVETIPFEIRVEGQQ